MLVFALNGVESITSISAQLGKEQRPGQGVARLHRFAGVIIIFWNDIERAYQYMCYMYTFFPGTYVFLYSLLAGERFVRGY
jgi:hypothetical protein